MFCLHCGGEVEQSLAGAGQTVALTATVIKLNKITLESCADVGRLSGKKAPYIKKRKCVQFVSGVLFGVCVCHVTADTWTISLHLPETSLKPSTSYRVSYQLSIVATV
jgi:hypothetical protein